MAVLFAAPVRDPVEECGVRSAIAGELARRFPGLSFDVRDLEDLSTAVLRRVFYVLGILYSLIRYTYTRWTSNSSRPTK